MRRLSLHVVTVLAVLALAPAVASAAASWTTQATPDPAGALLGALNGVDCTATNGCTGVGLYEDSGGVQRGLAERWNGASWASQATVLPASALSGELLDVDCLSASDCRAVGSYRDSGGVNRTFALTWNGSSWSHVATPNPAGALGAYLSGISCTATNACTAVGSYTDSGGVIRALAQRWTTSWATQPTPTPAGALTTVLADVACVSSTDCRAVGSFINASRVRVTLAMHWAAGTWSVIATADPAGHTGSKLTGISCFGASACTAVGDSLNGSSVSSALANRWAGAAWALESPPTPAGQSSASLSGVSCTSATHCTAVGHSGSGSPARLTPLAELYDGSTRTWTVQTAAVPGSSTDPKLIGVSCTSSAYCEAVGSYIDVNGRQRPFAEKWN